MGCQNQRVSSTLDVITSKELASAHADGELEGIAVDDIGQSIGQNTGNKIVDPHLARPRNHHSKEQSVGKPDGGDSPRLPRKSYPQPGEDQQNQKRRPEMNRLAQLTARLAIRLMTHGSRFSLQACREKPRRCFVSGPWHPCISISRWCKHNAGEARRRVAFSSPPQRAMQRPARFENPPWLIPSNLT